MLQSIKLIGESVLLSFKSIGKTMYLNCVHFVKSLTLPSLYKIIKGFIVLSVIITLCLAYFNMLGIRNLVNLILDVSNDLSLLQENSKNLGGMIAGVNSKLSIANAINIETSSLLNTHLAFQTSILQNNYQLLNANLIPNMYNIHAIGGVLHSHMHDVGLIMGTTPYSYPGLSNVDMINVYMTNLSDSGPTFVDILLNKRNILSNTSIFTTIFDNRMIAFGNLIQNNQHLFYDSYGDVYKLVSDLGRAQRYRASSTGLIFPPSVPNGFYTPLINSASSFIYDKLDLAVLGVGLGLGLAAGIGLAGLIFQGSQVVAM